MSSWYRLDLGDAMLADAVVSRIRAAFDAQALGDDATVYSRHESEGRLHCSLVVYFPPECADLARRFDAAPCARPSPHDLGLLSGRNGGSVTVDNL